jgi:NAD(P)-dependent dehydrogenase (short-subunit alcohol dehydrogenase family)
MRASIPLRRLGQAKDIANVILFLVSPSADYISGVALVVDGGLMTKLPLPD